MIKTSGFVSKIWGVKRTRIIIIVSLSSAFLLLAAYALASHIFWSNYTDDNMKKLDNALTDVGQVVTSAVDTKNKSGLADKLSEISKVQVRLTSQIKTNCNVNPVFGWQNNLGMYSDKTKLCDQKKDKIQNVLVNLGVVKGYLESEQRLADIITSANSKTAQNNTVDKWSLVEAFWRQAIVDLSKISDDNQFKTTKTLASGSFLQVAEAWKQLSSTNQSKDKQKFEQAKTVLTQAYVKIQELGDTSKGVVSKLTLNFTKSYQAAL